MEASVLNAAAHALSRLADIAIAAGGELTTIALRALHQHATASMRIQSAARYACGDGATSGAWPVGSAYGIGSAYYAAYPGALSGLPGTVEPSDSSSSNGEEGGMPSHLALGHVLDLSGAAEALISQLLAEMTKLVVALRAARDAVLTSAIGEADLLAVASRAGEVAKVRQMASIADLRYPPEVRGSVCRRRRRS